MIGTSVEWYDFYVYGTASALVFNKAFFPSFEPAVGTLLSFASFGVGTVIRPIGGFIFGHFGDRIGRKPMLVMSLVVMGIATMLIGLLPTYSAIGLYAPVLLVALRAVQGFALGGEWGGAILMAVEHAPRRKRALYGSLPQVGSSVGLVLGTAVFAVMSLLPEAQFQSWGWRVPFLLSSLLIVIGLIIRVQVAESPEFTASKPTADARKPFIEVFQRHPRNILVGICAIAGSIVAFYVVTVFTQSYAISSIGLSRTAILIGVLIAATGEAIAVVSAAVVADRVGARSVGIVGAIAICLATFPFFLAVNSGNVILVWIMMAVISLSIGIIYGVVPFYVSELFSTHVRYSGSSASYGVAAGVIGGLSPLAAAAMLNASGSYWPVALYVLFFAALSCAAFAMGIAGRGRRAKTYRD